MRFRNHVAPTRGFWGMGELQCFLTGEEVQALACKKILRRTFAASLGALARAAGTSRAEVLANFWMVQLVAEDVRNEQS